jgi:hypothetical protein
MTNTAPVAVLHAWRDALSAAEESLAAGALPALLQTLPAAARQRQALLAFKPLEVLRAHGTEVASALAGALDPGRRWLWHALLAGELAAGGASDQARRVAAELVEEAIRIPQASVDMVSTLLPPLYALEPALPVRLALRGFPVAASLRLLGGIGDAQQVLAVARALEAEDVVPLWEDPLVEGALQAQRRALVEASMALFERTYADPRMVTTVVLRDPAKRRETVLGRLGHALLKAGDGAGALAVWSQLSGAHLVFEPAWLACAGFAAEAEQLLARIPNARDRREAERTMREELAEQEAARNGTLNAPAHDPLGQALRAARRGEEATARRQLAEGLHRGEQQRGAARVETLCRAVQVLAALGERDTARRLKDKVLGKIKTARKADTRARMEIAIAEAELALGDTARALERLLRAAGELEDHDHAYERLQSFLLSAGAAGLLDAVRAALPPAGDELFHRERFIAYLAAAYAAQNQIETAFAVADSLTDPVDRDLALEYLVLTFMDDDPANAERAAIALQGSTAVSRLVEVATAWHRRGDAASARRLFTLATARAGTAIGLIGSVTSQALLLGYADTARPALAQGLNGLVLEEGEDWKHCLHSARDKSRQWLEQDRPVGGWWFRGLGNPPEPAEPARLSGGRSSDRIRALAQQARYLAARDEAAAARYVDEALTQWSGLAEQPWEQIALAPALAEAVGPERAYRLLPRIRDLLHHAERSLQDEMRGDWRRDLSWALACLGEWPAAFTAAYAIAQPRPRVEALQWLAWYAPLSAWRGWMRVLVEDEPVRVFVTARLQRELRQASLDGPTGR